MYSGKICYDSITGGHINIVLRGYHEENLQRVRHKTFAMEMPVA